jgi:hypothetical protein
MRTLRDTSKNRNISCVDYTQGPDLPRKLIQKVLESLGFSLLSRGVDALS